MYIYIFECDNCFKIGCTKNSTKSRMLSQQTGNPKKLKEYFKFKTEFPFKLETSLHNRFKSKRIENSEWFNLTKEDLELIENHCLIVEKALKEFESFDDLDL